MKQENTSKAINNFNVFLDLAPDYYNYYEEDLVPLIEDARINISKLQE
jgi:hypothetical protein